MKYNKQSVCSLIKQNYLYRCIAVVFFWLTGLMLGSSAAYRAVETIQLLLGSSSKEQIPIIGMLLLIVAPFVITAFVDRKHTRFLILIIVLIKATIYSYCLSAMMLAFNDASWLAKCLFMCSSSTSCVLLLFFWLESARNGSVNQRRLFSYLLLSASLVVIDYYVISPFAVVFY